MVTGGVGTVLYGAPLMSRISPDALDRGELERWVARLGLSAEWAAAEAFPV
jgi:hypothetical protein